MTSYYIVPVASKPKKDNSLTYESTRQLFKGDLIEEVECFFPLWIYLIILQFSFLYMWMYFFDIIVVSKVNIRNC